MDTKKRLAALLGAGLLMFAVTGTALATGASDQGVVPTEHAGNIKLVAEGNNIQADCDLTGNLEDPTEREGIETGNSGGSDTSPGGVTVTWTYDSETKEFGFEAEGGLVSIAYIKGSNSYNEYDYTGKPGGGVDSDGGMFAPDNNNAPAGLSHAVFCTTPGDEETEPPTAPPTDEPTESPGDTFEQSQEGETDTPTEPNTSAFGGSGTSGPADGAWLLVVALGVLLASIVVMTPARAKSQR